MVAALLSRESLQILIPVLVALIGSLAAPLWLARRKDRFDRGASLIEEGRELRRDLSERVETLEDRLEKASAAMNEALDEIRRLKSECERHLATVDALRTELAQVRTGGG